MADTSFTGKLMGIDNAVFNPSYSSVTTVKMNLGNHDRIKHGNDIGYPFMDFSTVDYLVHGKPECMVNVPSFTDVSIGYIPYHTVAKPVVVESSIVDDGIVRTNNINPKWYTAKKWNALMVAMSHKLHATCSIRKPFLMPESDVNDLFNGYYVSDDEPFVITERNTITFVEKRPCNAPTHNSVHDAVVFEFSTSMVETIPLSVKSNTRVVYNRDDSNDNMEYTPEYAALTGRALSPFFGMHGMELIDAKLNFIGGFTDHESDDVDYDPLYGVECIDESDDEIKHARDMRKYTNRLLSAANRVDDYARYHKFAVIGWSYKTTRSMTSNGMMNGNDALSEFKPTPNAFVFNDLVKSKCNEHYNVDEMNDLSTRSIYNTDSTVMDNDNGRVHYRLNHWMNHDIVETRAPEFKPTVFGASVLNLIKPAPVRNGVNSKFPIANARGYVYETDGFEWNLSFNASDKIGYAGFYFSPINMKTHKISNTGMGMIVNPKRASKMTGNVESILPFLTSEPMFVTELVESTGMHKNKLSQILKTAAIAGIVKTVTIKNKSTNFQPRAAYYL